jgi:predicted TIM-barrel fold metal-dependent hydrolase
LGKQIIDLVTTPTPIAVKEQNANVAAEVAALSSWQRAMSAQQFVADMDRAGVDQALVAARAFGLFNVPYQAIHEFVAAYPERLFALAGLDPRHVMNGVQRLDHAVRNLGFVGAHSYPHWFGLSPDDRLYYPFYAKCVELGIPVQIQVGLAWQRHLRSVGSPQAIETIARDFPELQVVAIHTGYPWERELVAVAEKHSNVYLGADTRDPRLWAPEIIAFLKGAGHSRVMFGTDYPGGFLASPEESLRAVETLQLDDGTKARLLCLNTRELYRLPERTRPTSES